jgi:hypothetical protein
MALHRDIYWVGKQWAVTGYGVQACDQKQKSKFDIEASRLWDDDVVETLRAHKWLNVEDLEKAISIARQRFPEPPRTVEQAKAVPVALQASTPTPPDPEPPKPGMPKFHMLFPGAARFVRPWRVRMQK